MCPVHLASGTVESGLSRPQGLRKAAPCPGHGGCLWIFPGGRMFVLPILWKLNRIQGASGRKDPPISRLNFDHLTAMSADDMIDAQLMVMQCIQRWIRTGKRGENPPQLSLLYERTRKQNATAVRWEGAFKDEA